MGPMVPVTYFTFHLISESVCPDVVCMAKCFTLIGSQAMYSEIKQTLETKLIK